MIDTTAPRIGTVMLIDDEEIDQMLYGRIVERSKHADQIISFIDANSALEHLVSGRAPVPDLVLLDISMPGMGGFDFLEAVEREFQGREAPYIAILTTSFDPKDAEKAKSSPLVRAYKSKPLSDAILGEIREDLWREDKTNVA